jgi:hydroxyacylglutathione hydrolase
MTLSIVEIPCLRDNYAYLVAPEGATQVVVIDPSEAEPVEAALAERGLELVAILNTHHHWDHIGGNEALCARRKGLPVYAHVSDRDKDRVPHQTHAVEHGKAFEVAGMRFIPLHVPGHTLGAVTYWVEDAAFTGDTLFIAGCGRLFEGTPAMMYESLCVKLGELPSGTRVFPGHEYTANNLRFAATIEPDNQAIADKLAWAQAQRAAGKPTVPSTMGEERATNPFLRVAEPAVAARYGDGSPIEVLAAVRAAKDRF